jgi:N-acetylglucosamine-6-phosphate deacetylase
MTCIRSVRLVLLDTILENAWITFEEGKITGFGQGEAPEAASSIDGKGDYLAPGLVDIHVHGGNGADFLDGTPEAFLTVADYHLSGGTTALCPTLATAPYDRIKAVFEVWTEVRGRSTAHLPGLHLEGPHLAKTKAGAQDPSLVCPPTEENISWLIEHASGIAQMTIAPELPNALSLIHRGSDAGIVMSLGHTEARETETIAAINGGATKVTHLFNAMTYAGKKGLFREVGLAEYALVENRLSCELIADRYHVTPTLMKLAYQTKGAGKLALISDALAGTGLPIGTEFTLGRLQCKVGDGVCLLADGSALAGSATRLMDQVRIVTETLGISVAEAVRMASHTPALLMGFDDEHGVIDRGRAADFVRFNGQFQVQQVWVSGKPVRNVSEA